MTTEQERKAFATRLPTTARGWAFVLAEGSNAAAKAGATADETTYLAAVEAIIKQAQKAARADLLADMERMAEALDDMWHQFSYDGNNGGLSSLENCEDALALYNEKYKGER